MENINHLHLCFVLKSYRFLNQGTNAEVVR